MDPAAKPTPQAGSTKPTGFLAYANVELKPRWPSLFKPAPEPAPSSASYKECLKNHAAIIGGHALDGCREFAPSLGSPLTCAACSCHRSFHRAEPTPSAPAPPKPSFTTPKKDSPENDEIPPRAAVRPAGKKRFRSKFTREQKEKMHQFCKREGWKLQRIDKRAVEEICNEVGVTKEVLRVWINNNKNSLRREDGINGGNGNGVCFSGDYGGHFEAVHMGSGNASSSSSE